MGAVGHTMRNTDRYAETTFDRFLGNWHYVY